MINKITYLLLLSICSFATLSAQEYDEVSVGAGYSKQTFYKLSDGSSISIDNNAWDICFSSAGQIDGGIFINESASSTGVPIKLFLAETTDWATVIEGAEGLPDSIALYNAEENWTEGAFNSVKNVNNQLDYGWGAYNPQNHTIVGNKIFIVKLRNGSFKKFQVVKLSGATYTFKYANLDGTEELEKTITKGNNPLVYFSFATNDVVATVPTDYDLVFQRYITPLDDGQGGILQYTVTGVLTGPKTEVAKAAEVDVETVKEEDFANAYSALPTLIGHDWKFFDFTAGWVLPEDLVFFVKTKSGAKYKLVFVDFQGSSNGTSTVERTLLSTSSTNEENQLADFTVYPNPFVNNLLVETAAPGDLKIYEATGKLVYNNKVNNGQNINLSFLSQGNYIYHFSNENGLKTGKLVK